MAEPGAEPGSEPGGSGPGGYDNDNDDTIMCICGKPFQSIIAKNCYNGSGVICDKCSNSINPDSIVYHCADENIKIHEGGYDLCSKCATKEKLLTQSQSSQPGASEGPQDNINTTDPGGPFGGTGGDVILDDDGNPVLLIPKGYFSEDNKPPCICGQELEQTPANKAYKGGGGIECDNCGRSCSGDVCVYVFIYYLSIPLLLLLLLCMHTIPKRYQYFIVQMINQQLMMEDMIYVLIVDGNILNIKWMKMQ